MHLLYLDDSGSVGNANDRHIVLAGLAVHERIPHWLERQLDQLASEIWPDSPRTLEFRGTDIRGGKKHWRGVGRVDREKAYSEALRIIANTSPKVRLFGAAIHRDSCGADDPMEFAFEQVINRFDRFLGRLHNTGDTQRGLVILDKSSYETSLQGLARNFKDFGHRWGYLRNMSDVPLFVDSQATRLIQFADLIAHALRRYVENGDDRYFEIIRDKFDFFGGSRVGLHHHTPKGMNCPCICCR
jgi:hypothetical protein